MTRCSWQGEGDHVANCRWPDGLGDRIMWLRNHGSPLDLHFDHYVHLVGGDGWIVSWCHGGKSWRVADGSLNRAMDLIHEQAVVKRNQFDLRD